VTAQKFVHQSPVKSYRFASPNSCLGLGHRQYPAGRDNGLTIPTIPAPEQQGREAQRIEDESAPAPLPGIAASKLGKFLGSDLRWACHENLSDAYIDQSQALTRDEIESGCQRSEQRQQLCRAQGLLMADEVMDMDFSRTLLVTLSGCETGVGVSVRGEGSVGIQRAFLIAGARHVLATLWPIQDVETVEFMKAFYARVVQTGETPPAALSAVQRELLVKRREKKGLAAAVNLTAPFILTSASQ
jgi:hypothetical protein